MAHLAEGTARIVAIQGDTVWLEPERVSACGGCVSAKACGHKSGSLSATAGRFTMPNDFGAVVGERIVVGIAEDALVRASATAYVIPLALMVGGALIGSLGTGSDAWAAGGAVGGLAIGMGLARLRAGKLDASGALRPHFLRRLHGIGDNCDAS